MAFCQQCGRPLPEESRFCLVCGTALAADTKTEQEPISKGKKRTRALLVWIVAVVSTGALLAWNMPIDHSEVQHHNAVTNPFLSIRAYDSGADFYLFNRCSIYVIVDGKKFSFPGDEQNDECVFANPGDALKAMAYVRGSDN